MEIKIDTAVALAQFEKRKKANANVKRIDNGMLPAGASMTYYCCYCGEHTATLSEGHWGPAPTVCEPCQVLRAHGLI